MPSDLFINTLTCPHCGTVQPEALVFSRIQDEPGAHDLRVGDPVEITRADLGDNAEYLPVKPFDPHAGLRLLETWICTGCKRDRWAEIVIGDDDTIKSIEAVGLVPEILDRANFIARRLLRNRFEAWTGVKLYEDNSFVKPYRKDFVELLRKHLAETPE